MTAGRARLTDQGGLVSALRGVDPALVEHVEQVEAALAAPDPALATAELDLLDQASVAEQIEAHYRRWPRWIEYVRNVLILVPLILTWLSLNEAGTRFGNWSAGQVTDPGHWREILEAAPRSFLELWQADFYGIVPYETAVPLLPHSFAGVAQWDATLLGCLAVLTVGAYGLGHRAARTARHTQRGLDRFVAEARADIATTQQAQERDHFEGALTRVLGETVASLNRVAADVGAERARLERLTEERELEMARVQTLSARLSSALTGIETALGDLGRVVSDYRQTTERIADHTAVMRELSSTVGEATGAIAGAARELVGVRDDLHAHFGPLSEGTATLIETLRRTNETHDGFGQALTTMAGELARQTGEIESGLRALQVEQVRRFDDATAALEARWHAVLDAQNASRLEWSDLLSEQQGALKGLVEQHGGAMAMQEQQLRAVLEQMVTQVVTLDRGLQAVAARVPPAEAVAEQITVVWSATQSAFARRLSNQTAELLDEATVRQTAALNGLADRLERMLDEHAVQGKETADQFAERLQERVADPLLGSSLLREVPGTVSSLHAAIGRVEALLSALFGGLDQAAGGGVSPAPRPHAGWLLVEEDDDDEPVGAPSGAGQLTWQPAGRSDA